MLYSENHSKLEHEMGGRNMRYTLNLIVVSIGIIELFQLVSIFSYICICFSCAYYIPISLSTNLVYDDKLELQPCFN